MSEIRKLPEFYKNIQLKSHWVLKDGHTGKFKRIGLLYKDKYEFIVEINENGEKILTTPAKRLYNDLDFNDCRYIVMHYDMAVAIRIMKQKFYPPVKILPLNLRNPNIIPIRPLN
jgi:hypothetical protein